MSNIAVYSVAFDLLLRYFTSPMSPTCIALILCIDYIDLPFNVHTTDKVTMGVNEWLPHYLIRSRSHSNSKG